jgi:phage-related tail fiber protein
MAQTQINGGTQIRSGSITSDRLASGTVADDRLATSYIKTDGTRAFTGSVSLGGFQITSLGDPTLSTDAATKAYVDGLLQGFDWKQSVRAASTATGTLSSAFANGQVIDGVTLATGDRILVKDQTNGAENGIYTVNVSGAPTRAIDADASVDMTAGVTVFISEGNAQGNSAWSITTDDAITLGTTAITFTQVAGGSLYTAGAGLSLSGSAFVVGAANTSITVNADDIQVNIGDASLEVSSGLRVKHGTAGQVYIANASGVLTPTTLSGDVSTVSSSGEVTLVHNVLKATDYVVRESPTGSVNGSNVAFTLAYTPVSGAESVFLNGILQEPGAGNDYTISTNTITFADAPVSGDRIRVSYIK